MKLVFLTCVALCIALVSCETCISDGDCAHEGCDADPWKVHCNVHPLVAGIGGQGICTCIADGQTGGSCTVTSDCMHSCPRLTHPQCMADNKCHCNFSFGNIGGVGK